MTAMPPPPSTPAPMPSQAAGEYATWGSRFLALLIDTAIVMGIALIGLVPVLIAAESGANGLVFVGVLIYLGAIAFGLWNQGWRQGETGQSIGKGVMGISVIRDNGQFMGGGLGIGRYIVHGILGGICFLDYLWPLWDDRCQTWTDKVVSTLVVKA